MGAFVVRFFEWMRVKAFSEFTVTSRASGLRLFAKWAEQRGITRPNQVTKPILDRYQRYLYHYRMQDGKPLSVHGQINRLRSLKAFFAWLTRHNYLLSNPAADMEYPRMGKPLPLQILSSEEVERILALPDSQTVLGLRDRAILEVLYATGIRRMEIVNLKIYDVHASRQVVAIREGKGRKDRVVPIGERALAWVTKYLSEVRPELAVEPDDGSLFLSRDGSGFTECGLSNLVAEYVKRSEVRKRGACHLFRHTVATLMLEGGADIRYIQAMLGHADLKSTQLYTQVSIRKLQEIYQATHPGAKLQPREREEEPKT